MALLSLLPSAVLFYTANLTIVSGYLFAAVLITRRVAVAKDLSVRAWLAGISFFVLCGLTHVELALHSYSGQRIIGDSGSVEWYMNLIHVPQALSIWLFLLSMVPLRDQPSSGPLLRLRRWWWHLGQPVDDKAPLEGVAATQVEDR